MRISVTPLFCAALILISSAYAVYAAPDGPVPPTHATSAAGISGEYMRAMDAMHAGMMEGVMDPDPDTAFVKGMLPHHQGAVDMARTVLKYGKDPELKTLARGIIDTQEREIAFMKEWLEKRGAKDKP